MIIIQYILTVIVIISLIRMTYDGVKELNEIDDVFK